MVHSHARLIFTSALAALLCGCSAVLEGPKPTIGTMASITALNTTFNLAGNITTYNTSPSETTKRTARDTIIDSGIALMDARYNEFVKQFTSSKKTSDTLAEVGSMGINTVGALMTPASTVRILSGIAGGITAANASYSKNFFYDKSLVVLIRQMNASRRAVLVDLLQGRKSDTGNYTLTDTLSDLGRYYTAGTFEGSLDAITQEAAEVSRDANLKIRNIRGVTVSWLSWINENGRDAAINLLLASYNALPTTSNIRAEILATATSVATTQFPPSVAFGAASNAAGAQNILALNIIYGTTVARDHSFNANPLRFEPFLRGHADPNALAEILGTDSLGLITPK